jgi:hypothetical protein
VANGHVFVDHRWVFPALDAQREGVARRKRNKQSGRCRRDLIERHMFLRVREVPAVPKPNFPVIQTSQTQELLSGDLRIIGND